MDTRGWMARPKAQARLSWVTFVVYVELMAIHELTWPVPPMQLWLRRPPLLGE